MSADGSAIEGPIYIEHLTHTRKCTPRVLITDGFNQAPMDPAEEFWNQISEIPLEPYPNQQVNAGPEGVVERVAMVLRPVAGSKLKWEFASWDGAAPPVQAAITTPLSRVIPANFGNGGYQPMLTLPGVGPTAYDGHTWLVDGLNHYVEFPYGAPEGVSGPPVLTFYRYTGTTGGSTGGSSGGSDTHLYLNRAATPAQHKDTIYTSPAGTFIGGVNGYDPADRLIPVNILAPSGTFSFEASGQAEYILTLNPAHIRFQVGIIVGDDYENINNVMGLTTTGADTAFSNRYYWAYKMTATRSPTGERRFAWTAEVTLCQSDTTSKQQASAGVFDFTSIPQINNSLRFSLYATNPDLSATAVAGAGLDVMNAYHVFKRIA